MKFLADEMKAQWPVIHPGLTALLNDFEVWSHKQNLPEPVICELVRTRKQQGVLYARIWQDEAKKVLEDSASPEGKRKHATEVLRMPTKDLEARGEKKFSWHVVASAADVRTFHYSKEQLELVRKWFEERCHDSLWELVSKPHGTGAHVHVARRDFSWRKKMEAGYV